jgi:ABC-2 type transport system permease protein
VIRVELAKMLRRPRTWVTIAMLNALPTLVAVLLAVTDIGPRPGQGPPFLSAVLTDGTLFPLAALAIVLPLFMPVAVAVTAGDAVAGEAQGGTLRYVLTRPVGRTRLLVAKLVSVLAFVALAVVVVAVVGYVVGRLFLGGGDVQAVTGGAGGVPGVTGVSGTSLSQTQLLERTLMAIAYVALSMLSVAAVALLLSTFTDSPLGAALGALAFLIASTLLLTLDAAHSLQPYLPTRYWLSFVDLFRDPILWRDVDRGVLLQGVYVLVFLAAAWANFTTRDIKS